MGSMKKIFRYLIFVIFASAVPVVNAAEPPTLYYRGDPAFCRAMLERAREVEYVEPVLPDPPKERHYFYADDDSTFVYFTDKTVSIQELSDAVLGGNWEKLFEGGFAPGDPKKAAGWVVMSDAWKALDRQCPGFLLEDADQKTGERLAPNHFALYRVDIDNDGEEDTVLFRETIFDRQYVQHYDRFEFETCSSRHVFGTSDRTRVLRYSGKTYFATYWGGFIRIYEVDPATGKASIAQESTCSFHGWRTDFDELTDYLTKPWSLKWRK